jgi:hypothetical protein
MAVLSLLLFFARFFHHPFDQFLKQIIDRQEASLQAMGNPQLIDQISNCSVG